VVLLVAVLLLAAAAHYLWNISTLYPLIGYDDRGHMQYLATLVDEGRLPHPLEGWSTFHPPLYYLSGSLVSWPGRPVWSPLGLLALSALALLAAGLVSFRLVLHLGGGLAVAGVATALVLFVPCSQLAATMVGNEALGAGLAALALPALVRLQANPRELRTAAFAGLMAGLALATKYTGLFVAAACMVPFCRGDFDKRTLRALVLCGFVGVLVAGPVYVRNIKLTGSPIPMTRELEPMKGAEESLILRERRLLDYLWINPASLLRPSVQHMKGEPPASRNRNPAMTSVWGLTYASMWYDAHSHRIPGRFHRDGIYAGPLLTLLGIVPTALVVAGFLAALWGLLRRRGNTPDASLVVMAIAGLLTFVTFTWKAPSAAAVKASYLLPLVVPAAVFFARGVGLLSARLRAAGLLVSAVAALAAALVFANGLVFPMQASVSGAEPERPVEREAGSSRLDRVGHALRGSAPGRWQKVQPPLPMEDGRILWRIVAHDFPDTNETATAAWCIYIGELMSAHLPGEPWLAVIGQKGTILRTCNDRDWRAIRHPFLKASKP
jgi:4-amino-4-deoxy-L-arabinose transferase-like glycosyltransferase